MQWATWSHCLWALLAKLFILFFCCCFPLFSSRPGFSSAELSDLDFCLCRLLFPPEKGLTNRIARISLSLEQFAHELESIVLQEYYLQQFTKSALIAGPNCRLIKSSEMLDEQHCSSAKGSWLVELLTAVKASPFFLPWFFALPPGTGRENIGTSCPQGESGDWAFSRNYGPCAGSHQNPEQRDEVLKQCALKMAWQRRCSWLLWHWGYLAGNWCVKTFKASPKKI